MFAHNTAERILVGFGIWLIAAALFALLMARWMRHTRQHAFDQHVDEALDLLNEMPLLDRIAEEQGRKLVAEVEVVLWLEAQQ